MATTAEKSGFKRAYGTILKATAIVQSGLILEGLSDSYLQRNVVAEPFDLPDHIGNFKEGSLLTSAFCTGIGLFACLGTIADRDPNAFKKRARITAGAGFLLSAGVQFLGEKYGLNNVIGGSNTPDMLDAAYGTAWSAVTAAAAYKVAVTASDQVHQEREARMAEWREQLSSQQQLAAADESVI